MIGIITYISVLERTKEIGILRSIGASKKDISRIFNAETLIEGFVAGALGIIVTLILCVPANAIIKNVTSIANVAQLPVAGGVILVIIYTTVLNKVLLFGGSKMEVKIISRNPEQIRQAIIGHLDRGLTILRAEGGYSQEDHQVLLVVVSNCELPQLERIVKNIDPESFVIVSEAREVSGRGFSLTKEHKSTQRKEN